MFEHRFRDKEGRDECPYQRQRGCSGKTGAGGGGGGGRGKSRTRWIPSPSECGLPNPHASSGRSPAHDGSDGSNNSKPKARVTCRRGSIGRRDSKAATPAGLHGSGSGPGSGCQDAKGKRGVQVAQIEQLGSGMGYGQGDEGHLLQKLPPYSIPNPPPEMFLFGRLSTPI